MDKSVSFDFDGTLTQIVWSEALGVWINSRRPNEKMVRLLRRLAQRGYQVHIVTRRRSDSEGASSPTEECGVGEFLHTHGLGGCVTAVHFCGDHSPEGDKTAVLKKIAPLRHWDDLDQHVQEARRAGIKARKVRRPAGSERS
ncbi:MAG: hypothetical protein ABFD92_08790 [Planctomycetaceae bacterium]|nr:hypothetical protein [Planctomycetaceae bacterium]